MRLTQSRKGAKNICPAFASLRLCVSQNRGFSRLATRNCRGRFGSRAKQARRVIMAPLVDWLPRWWAARAVNEGCTHGSDTTFPDGDLAGRRAPPRPRRDRPLPAAHRGTVRPTSSNRRAAFRNWKGGLAGTQAQFTALQSNRSRRLQNTKNEVGGAWWSAPTKSASPGQRELERARMSDREMLSREDQRGAS
jgi:hypothetical protein